VAYLTNKADYLRYDTALAAGWPIATGIIEGACRHLRWPWPPPGAAIDGMDGPADSLRQGQSGATGVVHDAIRRDHHGAHAA